MSDSKPPSQQSIPPQHPTGVSEALAQVRVYSDDAALVRVWNRLDTQRRRSPILAPAVRGGISATLVAAGVFLGIFYERTRVDEGRLVSSVSSEVITAPEAPAGPRSASPQFQAPQKDQAKEDERKSRVRRRIDRLSSVARPSVKPLDEAPAKSATVEVEEVAPQTKAEWVLLVERGDYAAAYQRLEESGGFDAVLSVGSSEELMTLVEVARFVGQQGRAIQALRAVTERHKGDANAPIAAMILGNLLNKSGDSVGAAQAYALNRLLSPGGDFAEDALVGEFDMALAARDVARVERLRAEYVAEFPAGRHLESINAEARRLLERSGVSSADGESNTPGADSDSGVEDAADAEFDDEPESEDSVD